MVLATEGWGGEGLNGAAAVFEGGQLGVEADFGADDFVGAPDWWHGGFFGIEGNVKQVICFWWNRKGVV